MPQNDEQPVTDKIFCFLSAERVCGPDCMAFLTFPRRADTSELSEMQTHCALLTAADRLGRNVTIIASTLVERSKQEKTRRQDEERARGSGTPPIPAPLGSPFPVGRKS